jgi:hypothetical protein
MRSTWTKSDYARQSLFATGFTLFIAGLAIASYCGYQESYIGDPQSDLLIFAGWCLLFTGLLLFLGGLILSPIHR